jgi:predicted nucleic acid-binding protein
VSYLIETSVWVSYLRDRGGERGDQVDRLLRENVGEIVGCPAVRMELAIDSDELRRRRLLKWYDGFPTTDVVADDFDLAAAIHREVRSTGHTVRSATDCLIAAAAVRSGCTLVHSDVDFDRISTAVPELAVLRLGD